MSDFGRRGVLIFSSYLMSIKKINLDYQKVSVLLVVEFRSTIKDLRSIFSGFSIVSGCDSDRV